MAKEYTLSDLDFTDQEKRKKFVNENESGLYSGTAVDGDKVIVLVQKGEELTVKWENSRGWYEGVVYDKDGERIDEVLEKA